MEKNSKVKVIVFSPTGTTAKVAGAVASGMGGVYETVDLTCGDTHELHLSADDVAVIAAPVYGGKMAPVARRRIGALRAESTPCVLIAVYGNRAFENAVTDMAEAVGELGFKPVAAGAFVGEHSYSTAATPIAVGRPDREDLAEAVEFGRAVAEKLSRGDVSVIDAACLCDQPSPEQSLLRFREFVMEYMKRQKDAPVKLLPEVDASRCNGCGRCVDLCSTGAIAADCHGIDATKCIKCCACVKGCPSGARSLISPFAPVLSENFSARKPPVWVV